MIKLSFILFCIVSPPSLLFFVYGPEIFSLVFEMIGGYQVGLFKY